MNDKQAFFASLGISQTLPDHFSSLGAPSYKTYEISELIRNYDMTVHPLGPKVLALLIALRTFRSESSLDFQRGREESKTDQELLATLNTIGTALQAARDQLNMETRTDGSLPIFSTAISYCFASVKERLEKLNVANDKIYRLYTNADNSLKTLMASNSPHP